MAQDTVHPIIEAILAAEEIAPEARGEDVTLDALTRCAREPQNDTGNARRLIAYHGREILHVREIGWHAWTGTHWAQDGAEAMVSRLAQETSLRIRMEAQRLPVAAEQRTILDAAALARDKDTDQRTPAEADALAAAREIDKQLAQRAGKRRAFSVTSGNASRVREMANIAATRLTAAHDELDRDPLAINVRNGTLRVRWAPDPECPDPDTERQVASIELTDHRIEDRITRMMAVAYDPDADCPKWRAFVERFLPVDAVRGYVQRYYGYCLTGSTADQTLLFHHGAGANGKSTFCEAIGRLMGSYTSMLPAESIVGEQHRNPGAASPDLARLAGVRLVRVDDLPPDVPLREGTVKQMTGGAALPVRNLNEGIFELRPRFKCILLGNRKPRISGGDYAVARRIRMVPWPVRIAEAEKRDMDEILAEFDEEAPGILNWLLDGLRAYLEDGLAPPPEVRQATEEYRTDMDPIGEFVKAAVAPYPGGMVTAAEMYKHYKLWCENNAVAVWGPKAFGQALPERGIRKKLGRVRQYLDVRLIGPEDFVAEGEGADAAGV